MDGAVLRTGHTRRCWESESEEPAASDTRCAKKTSSSTPTMTGTGGAGTDDANCRHAGAEGRRQQRESGRRRPGDYDDDRLRLRARTRWRAQLLDAPMGVDSVGFSTGPTGETIVDVNQVVRDLAGNRLADTMVGHVFRIEDRCDQTHRHPRHVTMGSSAD